MSRYHHTPLADAYLAADAAVAASEAALDDADADTQDHPATRAWRAAQAYRAAARLAWLESDEIREWEYRGDSLGGGTEQDHWHRPSDVEEELADWARDGDYDRSGVTYLANWAQPIDPVTEEPVDEYPYEVASSVVLEPDAPACTEDEHDWCSPHEVVGGIEDNPGVQGHGGGVLIREVCRHCGVYQVTDTWATNRATGEQGCREVSYEEADEDSLAWIAR